MRKHITVFFLILVSSLFSQKPNYTVSKERLLRNLKKLSEFGINNNNGNDRVAYSDYDIQAREYIKKYMKNLGLKVEVDYAANIVARKEGTNKKLKPIAFGSHIDAVPNGGHYDGPLGVIGGIEALETILDNEIITSRPLELIIFTNEEGGVFGSRALAGKLNYDALEVKTASGFTNGEGVDRLGGDQRKIFDVIKSSNDYYAFVELHIEQGNILNKSNIDIGVVTGIVGLKWWDVTIEGVANHAGTTPMGERKDPMITAADFILLVKNVINEIPGNQVGTVGKIEASPGAPNVIPGKVKLSLEIRDLDENKIDFLFDEIEKRARIIALENETIISFSSIDINASPALMDDQIQALIIDASNELNYSFKKMPSGAGHDAQDMAIIAPSGMIFIPSVDGISHSPKEFSSDESVYKGTNILLNTILKLDKEKF
ncbi:MAG: Zn-dependent hydrolase [Flavobacteriaceae bacterium]|tara:strand:+ start:1027 stop:2319 length:1293 start_codon:yes stop_codon:yes gene_type:complete